MVQRLRTEERVITIYRRANSSFSDLVYTGELIQGWDEDFSVRWIKATDEASLPGSPSLLAFMERGVRSYGAANDKKRCTLKTSKGI